MNVSAEVRIDVVVDIDAGDGRLCGAGCQFKRQDKCVLYREPRPGNRRCAPCIRDVRLPETDNPELVHLHGRPLDIRQLRDIVAEDTLDYATRRRLANKWQTEGTFRESSSFGASDSYTYGYGPTDKNGFFAYSVDGGRR